MKESLKYKFVFKIIFLDCAECGEDLRNGQALYALDRQWHIYCFKCHECNAILHGEYMGRYMCIILLYGVIVISYYKVFSYVTGHFIRQSCFQIY